jgi:hypothetical protein
MKVKELFETQETTLASIRPGLGSNYIGDINVYGVKITSLFGSPSIVRGGVDFAYNKLTSLKYGPAEVSRYYDCSHNELISLEGAAHHVDGEFDCSSNKLTSLNDAPVYVGGNFCAGYNLLTSLKGIHKQIKHIGGTGYFNKNPIRSHVLGLLKITKLSDVALSNTVVQQIINKHLKGDKDIFACQEELIEAGYPEYAQL